MDGQFVTNKDLILSDIINSILPKCDNAYFLVGYFYFSGFAELCEKLKNVNLKVLVGLEVERNIINGIKEVENFTTSNKSRGQLREDFYKGFVDIYNNTDFFDSEEQIEKFRLFLQKIENGTLEVKKTSDPNHAKLYLFQNREEECVCGTFPGTMITGSSNLSVTGLKNRFELNVILRDKPSYVEGKSVFDELWDTAVTIVDEEHIADFKEKVIKHIWFEKLYPPYAMFIRVLHEYFNIATDENILTPSDITEGTYSDLKYQTDAVQLALNSIKNHEGVIISDVVGLGKSIIASTVARNLRLRTIIICPPHLKQQWEEYKDEFGFTASVFSTGKVETALNHYRMIARTDEKFLIIVDEAHKYKNEFILDYSILHDLCMSNKVMLLTATPFNNRPEDIYSMLKFFQIPSKSTLKTVGNLGAAFKDLISRYKDLAEGQRKNMLSKSEIKSEADSIAQNIRSIISPLVVRRSRLDLEEIPEYKEDLKRQHINPVIPEPPVQLGYYLGDIRELYLRTLNLISPTDEEKRNNPGFHYYESARYKPTAYIVDDEKSKKELDKELEEKMGTDLGMLIGRQVNVSLFMRRMLVRRYESSVAAFRDSLNSMIDSSEHILKWIEKRDKVLVYKKGALPDVEEFYETTADDLSEEIAEAFDKYQERGFFEIDMKYIKREEFLNDIQADLQLLKDIRAEWFKPKKETVKGKSVTTYDMKFDYKLDAFRKLLKEQRMADPTRKIIIFTEFADTANYLGAALENEGLGVFKYTSREASSTNKSIIRANFDAGLKPQYQKDDYQILIATDAISEGYNLHRAGTIFNCLDVKDNDNYVDGFSDRKEVQKSLFVPDYLFFAREHIVDLSHWYADKRKKEVKVNGILNILKRYNFTIEENTPFDQEVSLDPELLGKVFENLLASYNPETQTTARKQTGSFYTPRDIVQYMVDESLVAYLKRMVGEELEAEYRKLISYVDEEDLLTDAQKQQVIEAIYHCKILDPACGSGAFPVGMLQQMVHILSKLDPTNEQWKKMMLDNAVNESRSAFQAESKEEREERLKDIENSFDENLNNPDYARKLFLIENCIYGVDIQPIAIQISKLRFFISLVVDQKTTADPTNNFGIRPLPNLEAKFVAANSLIPLVKTENNLGRTPEIIAVENKLKEANHKIFGAKTIRTKRKWRERLIELRAEMAEKLVNNGFLTTDAANQLASWDMFNQNTSASFFDAEWMFGVKDGFDVVIGNPPYGAKLNDTEKKLLRRLYVNQTSETAILFIERGHNELHCNGVLSYIIPKAFTYSSNYKSVRNYVKKDIAIIVDCGKAFEQVKLEACIISLRRNNNLETYSNLLYSYGVFTEIGNIPKSTCDDFGLYLNGVTPESVNIANKMQMDVLFLGDISSNCRGEALQSYIKDDGEIDIIGGKNIDRYGIRSIKGKLNTSSPILGNAQIQNNSLLYQNIVAHITTPYPQIKLIGCIPNRLNCYIIDTINQITIDVKYSNKYIWALLNSKLICWYAYLFIYGKAIRTMHFDSVSTNRIPIKLSKSQSSFIEIIDSILSHKEDLNIDKTAQEMLIDKMVYQLYNLTYDEVLIVDPNTAITREEYEK